MQLLLKLSVLLPRPYVTLDDFDALFRTLILVFRTVPKCVVYSFFILFDENM